MIQNFASTIAKSPVSLSWVDRFLNRHPDALSRHWTTSMDCSRQYADSYSKYYAYFQLISRKIQQYSVETKNTYNMDKKGFMLGVVKRTKRIFDRGMWMNKEARHALQDGSREWITICADGQALPPALIFASKSSTLQESWVDQINANDHGVHVSASESGWSNDKISVAWLEQVFDRHTKHKALTHWRLLILDGHGSHVTQPFLDYCDRNRILVFLLLRIVPRRCNLWM
jgi:hypothetical protein